MHARSPRKKVQTMQQKPYCSGELVTPIWRAYMIEGIEEHFPKAHITFDKFHVMKMVNQSVDQVRREEQKETNILKKTRYVWLKNEQNLTESQRQNGLN